MLFDYASSTLRLRYDYATKILHRVHETLLDFVEDEDAESEKNEHKAETIAQPAPANELACTQSTMLEGLDDRGDGVQAHEDGQIHTQHLLACHLTQGINDRRGIHPQRHEEGKQDLKVAVLGGHGRDDDAEAQGQTRHHHHQKREEQQIPVGARRLPDDDVIEIDNDKQPQLDAKTHQIADDAGEGHDHPREIDLAKDASIGDKRIRGLVQTIGEILPHSHTTQVEQWLRYAVGGDARDATKHDHVHNNCESWLDDPP